jgi:hypothetical protein
VNVIRINLLLSRDGADSVTLFTDLPSPMPYVSEQNMCASFLTTRDKGAEYISTNFPGIPVVIIDYERTKN